MSFHSHHENPVGINVDSKDVAGAGPANDDSEGFSSTWAAALPRLVQRRNGLTGAIALGLKRSNSQDSNLNLSRSVSIRSKRFNYNSSMNSRRHSVADSGLAGTDEILLFAWLISMTLRTTGEQTLILSL